MLQKTLPDLRKDAIAIFQTGLAAAAPGPAIHAHCRRDGDWLHVGYRSYDLSRYETIRIIGAGKAAAAMAQTLEALLGDRLDSGLVTVK
jgi:hydroxypyruvate reductase